MAKAKSIKNIRQEFKEQGIFYTPKALAEKIKSYVDIEPKTVYDPTCGAGSLLSVFPDEVLKYGQELDAEQLSLIHLPNFTGYASDTLMDDGFKDKKFDCIVANPPFSIKWNPDALKDDVRFKDCPDVPPPSKADWAFMLHILHHLDDNGIAVVCEYPGILYRGQKEGKVRQWFVEKNYIDRIVDIEGNTFEDTTIATNIIVLKKNRTTTDIIFERKEEMRSVPLVEIIANDFKLSPSTYIQDKVKKEEVDINDINKDIVENILSQIEAVFGLMIMMGETFHDNFYLKELVEGLKNILARFEGEV